MVLFEVGQLIIAGRNTQFILFVAISAFILIGLWLGARGQKFTLRPLPAINALSEAIGRAAELGKPVHYHPGYYTLYDVEAPQTVAALSILTKVTELAAKSNVQLIVTTYTPDILPLVDELVRTGYTSGGKPELYNTDNVRFISTDQWAYCGGIAKIFAEEAPAANIVMGGLMAYSLMLMSMGVEHDMIGIGGTASWHQISFLVATSDYVLIAEELYAGGAYVSNDPVLIGSLFGQDLSKYLTIFLIIVGIALSLVGSNMFFQWIAW